MQSRSQWPEQQSVPGRSQTGIHQQWHEGVGPKLPGCGLENLWPTEGHHPGRKQEQISQEAGGLDSRIKTLVGKSLLFFPGTACHPLDTQRRREGRQITFNIPTFSPKAEQQSERTFNLLQTTPSKRLNRSTFSLPIKGKTHKDESDQL